MVTMRTLIPALLLWCTAACEPGVQSLEYEVLRTLPHDPEAYTQGLVFHEGILFESTGRYGTSTVRKTNAETGEILRLTPLSEEHFGEGLAMVGSELYQLTWKAGLAFVYDADSLTLKRALEYSGEGWGLCYDGELLFMSNGSDRLFLRDPETFEALGELRVTENGLPVWRLNELECVENHVFANVYQTTRIVKIDKASGEVAGYLDGFRLSATAKRVPDPEAVLNGIAYDPERRTLLVTGKLWQNLFEIRIPEG
jgi:glutamine cyclotransferase